MRASEMLETAGVPTYYITHTVTENAGGGNVRVWNCIHRNGVLVPRCEIIIPATRLILAAKNVGEVAQAVFNAEMLASDGIAH